MTDSNFHIKISDILNDKGHYLISDEYFTFGITKRDNLREDTLKEHYGGISFGFEILDRVREVVKAMYGESYGETDIRLFVPKEPGLLIAIARHPRYKSAAHEDSPHDMAIVIAPRLEEGTLARSNILHFGPEEDQE